MSIAEKADPKLWRKVKTKWLEGEKGGVPGKWNARKAMLAVQEYKRRGGTYVGPRDPKNRLKKWEKEDWGYIDDDPKGRYLPAGVRARLTPAEKAAEKRRKRGRRGENVPYTVSVAAKMRAAGVFGAGRDAKASKRSKKPKTGRSAKSKKTKRAHKGAKSSKSKKKAPRPKSRGGRAVPR